MTSQSSSIEVNNVKLGIMAGYSGQKMGLPLDLIRPFLEDR